MFKYVMLTYFTKNSKLFFSRGQGFRSLSLSRSLSFYFFLFQGALREEI